MPYYDFECTQCHEVFSQKQTFAEHDKHRPVKCPKCSSTKVKQLIAAAFAKTSKKS